MRHTDLPQDTPEQKMAVKNCILFQKCGSVAYGLHIPGKSDEDYMGVFIPDETYNGLGLKNIEQVEFRSNPTDSGRRNTNQDMDCTLYSLHKFVKLLLNNNPNILESLFYPENCRLYVNSYGQTLINNSGIFVSKKAHGSFRGYAFAQIQRLERGEQKQDVGRVDLVKQFGFDVKMASHVLRLYLECNELLGIGTITLPLKENNFVLACKKGEFSKERFLSEANRLEKICDSLFTTSTIPSSPNYEAAHSLLMKMNKDFYAYGKSRNAFSKILSNFFREISNYLDN